MVVEFATLCNPLLTWRKKADISDIEAILDDVRREERFGGPLDEREDEDLMFLDTGDYETGSGIAKENKNDEAVELQFQLDTTPGSSTSKKQVETFKPSKKPANKEPIQAFRFIDGLQGAKVPIKPRMKAGVVTAAMQEKAKRITEDPKTAKKYQRKVEDIKSGLIRRHRVKVTNFKCKNKKDIWEETDDTVKECYDKGLDEDYLDNIATYYKSQTKKGQKIAVPSHRLKKPSAHPAVPLPAAGMSYHPTFEDHQEVLREAVKDIKKKQKIEKRNAKYTPVELKRLKSKIKAASKKENWAEDVIETHTIANDDVLYSGPVEGKKNEQKVKIEKQTKGKKGGNKKDSVKEEIKENTEFDASIVKEEIEGMEAEEDQNIDTEDNEEIDEDDFDEESEVEQDGLDEESEVEQDDLDEESEVEQDDLDEESEVEQDDLDEESEVEQDDLNEESEVEHDGLDEENEAEQDVIVEENETEQDVIVEENETEQDVIVEENEMEQDEVDEEKGAVQDDLNNSVENEEIDSEKENELQPKSKTRKRRKVSCFYDQYSYVA
ncbi:hypothetical protein C7M84_005507 [Penaeus vannamei]|uniref:Ribosome biogenesis protein NOP53 n=1 Tax=Penaeus vannamei TaxID=6689 RepID=A0A423THK7_PENVA|nr:hypothetical protein C7M84_005507 [Penaeus vannamei]